MQSISLLCSIFSTLSAPSIHILYPPKNKTTSFSDINLHEKQNRWLAWLLARMVASLPRPLINQNLIKEWQSNEIISIALHLDFHSHCTFTSMVLSYSRIRIHPQVKHKVGQPRTIVSDKLVLLSFFFLFLKRKLQYLCWKFKVCPLATTGWMEEEVVKGRKENKWNRDLKFLLQITWKQKNNEWSDGMVM